MTPEDAGAYFMAHRTEIEDKAISGDKACLNILLLRKMFYACPNDPGALGLLCAALSEYQEKNA